MCTRYKIKTSKDIYNWFNKNIYKSINVTIFSNILLTDNFREEKHLNDIYHNLHQY